MHEITIRPMCADDYEDARELWEKTEGMGLRDADSRTRISDFIIKNEGLCYVCVRKGRMIGTLLCGYDGRRGYLYHLAVDTEFRRKGIAKALIEACLTALKKKGGDKCHLFVFNENEAGKMFWQKIGWQERNDISVYSKNI